MTMHARKNGDAGIQVWLAFKKEGWLEKFTYAELAWRMTWQTTMISAMLRPNPVHHRQSKDITTVAFSADPNLLAHCSFLVVCYDSNEGDVGYYLKLKDFLDLRIPSRKVTVSSRRKAVPFPSRNRWEPVMGEESER